VTVPSEQVFADDPQAARARALAESSRRERVRAVGDSMTPDVAASLAANGQMFWWLKPGTILSLAQARVGPEIWEAAGRKQAEVGGGPSVGERVEVVPEGGKPRTGTAAVAAPKKKAGFWDKLGAVLPDVLPFGLSNIPKPIVRGAFTGLQTGTEAVAAVLRHNTTKESYMGMHLSPGQGGSFRDLVGQTTGGQAALQALDGERVDLGSGYLPGGTAAERQAEAARRAAPMIDGHARTFGRYIGSHVFEPGSTPYNLMSGTLDGGVSVGLDPANVPLRAAGTAVKAAKRFTPVEAGLVNGYRPSTLPEITTRWRQSEQGQAFRDYWTVATSPTLIRRSASDKMPVDVAVRWPMPRPALTSTGSSMKCSACPCATGRGCPGSACEHSATPGWR
jgi:hypothetical protein